MERTGVAGDEGVHPVQQRCIGGGSERSGNQSGSVEKDPRKPVSEPYANTRIRVALPYQDECSSFHEAPQQRREKIFGRACVGRGTVWIKQHPRLVPVGLQRVDECVRGVYGFVIQEDASASHDP